MTTINMWSKFKLEGSFQVEFDYLPVQAASGGTMLQLCGTHFNPIQEKPMKNRHERYMHINTFFETHFLFEYHIKKNTFSKLPDNE